MLQRALLPITKPIALLLVLYITLVTFSVLVVNDDASAQHDILSGRQRSSAIVAPDLSHHSLIISPRLNLCHLKIKHMYWDILIKKLSYSTSRYRQHRDQRWCKLRMNSSSILYLSSPISPLYIPWSLPIFSFMAHLCFTSLHAYQRCPLALICYYTSTVAQIYDRKHTRIEMAVS